MKQGMTHQSPSFLHNEGLSFLLFGGKGGVGKTTAAAAAGLYLASQRPDRKVLVISTDPAHSLSDSFDQPIGDRVTPIEGIANLFALEMDAPRRMEEFKAKYREELETIAYRGTIFDQEDISEFLSLSLPGMDEMMAIIEIAHSVKGGEYALIVLDTAPTGHTIKLLELPDLMLKWLDLLELMQKKYRYIVRRLTGRLPKDKVDDFLAEQSADVRLVKSLFADHRSTEFVPVTIPEKMAIEETQRLLDALTRLRLSVKTILINRVAADSECPFCHTRTEGQKESLEEIERRFSSHDFFRVRLLPYEVRGRERLESCAQVMLGEEIPELQLPEPTAAISLGRSDWHGLDQAELILFGGKGGVGKTTSAAATALYLSTLDKKRTLIFSTDPAHSLCDSFDREIGDRVTPIAGVDNLFAMEMDANRLLEELKVEYRESIDEAFDSFLKGGIDVPYDRAIMEELINSTPPGIDELMALMKVMDFMEAREFDRYILDMAPTGHALRFLELPDIVREWFKTAFRLIIKYKGVAGVRLNKTAETFLRRSKQLRLVEGVLRDPQRCQFVCVAIPEAMSVAETNRLVERLAKLNVACREAIVNMVVPPTKCRFCSAKRQEQQKCLKELSVLGLRVTEAPLFSHQVMGLEHLRGMMSAIYGSGCRSINLPTSLRRGH